MDLRGVGVCSSLTQSVYIQDVLQGLGPDEDGDWVELGGLQPAHRVGRHVQDAVLTLLLTHTHTHTHTHRTPSPPHT